MKKLIGLLFGLMLMASMSYAMDTYHFFATGTATAAASTVISILDSANVPTTSNTILVLNDSTTVSIYVDLSGRLTEAYMTAESKALTLKAGEYFTTDFRTNKIKVRGSAGSVAYRIWALF